LLLPSLVVVFAEEFSVSVAVLLEAVVLLSLVLEVVQVQMGVLEVAITEPLVVDIVAV